jgi:signal transduction histidine kinase
MWRKFYCAPLRAKTKVSLRKFPARGSKVAGLGLSNVDSVMQNHGGKVDVVSKPGAGTTFTLFFSTTAFHR